MELEKDGRVQRDEPDICRLLGHPASCYLYRFVVSVVINYRIIRGVCIHTVRTLKLFFWSKNMTFHDVRNQFKRLGEPI